MSNCVKSIKVHGLFNRFDLHQEFYPGVNVLFGENGKCKTTLLHILVNALNGDYERFAFLVFRSIVIQLDDGKVLKLTRQKEMSEFRKSADFIVTVKIDNDHTFRRFLVSEIENIEPTLDISSHDRTQILDTGKAISSRAHLPAFYFPAFRIAIDAWRSNTINDNYWLEKKSRFSKVDDIATHFIRRWLLPFVPYLNYPSLLEIEQILSDEKNIQVKYVEQFLISINKFLEEKELIVNHFLDNPQLPKVELVYNDGMRSKGFAALSSGERQIVSILYAASQVSSQKVILLDEPEISLHVDWQRKLLREISGLLEGKQIIVCTHSPVIGADYNSHVMELGLTMTKDRSVIDDDEELPY